ncbi:MAG: phosphoenolpyruvate synthase [Planctomycetes bacterium]|nr:phosphoenolpyruvate synthase [Planctomycetota bacterium]
MQWIKWFEDVDLRAIPQVGGKNAALGELIGRMAAAGCRVPQGFAVTAQGYRSFLEANGLVTQIQDALTGLDLDDVADLSRRGAQVRTAILAGTFPPALAEELRKAYRELCTRAGEAGLPVAVRSSATAEDLPNASFAGQQESFLHVRGEEQLLDRVRRCYASLYTDRAISYREKRGFEHLKVALSAGVQQMVRSDRASSGVIFTLDPESGFRDVIYITSSWGLGENVVQGRVGPDAFVVHKPTLRQGFASLVGKQLGAKEQRLVYDPAREQLQNETVSAEDRARFSLSEEDALTLARWALEIEDHWSADGTDGARAPMDIEWAKDAVSGELFIVQARPETVHSQRTSPVLRQYTLEQRGEPIVEGLAVGDGVATGHARVILDLADMHTFQAGEVLVTEITDPDWEPLLKKASAVVTQRGGRTSHAAIVAREMGLSAVVGASGACAKLSDGAEVTVSCAEGETGYVYAGALPFRVLEVDPSQLERPQRTKVLLNVANPEVAFSQAQLPSDGIGLARMEFVYAGWVKVHPLALTRFATLTAEDQAAVRQVVGERDDPREYLVEQLAHGVGTLAAAFYPRPVILRFSDFKTNEYARLVGGSGFEPDEENPMLGWRGASRYYHPDFKEGFELEVAAVRRVREVFGLTNLKVMIPFCRTPEEGLRVLEVMAEGGLERGKDGLEVYVMAEVPSNVILADRFAEVFDGFSIGTNDLTQLVLGVDRDSDRIAALFDERNEAVKRFCAQLITTAHAAGKPVGICGQAPSDHPDFAAFLVSLGIDSVSLTADAVIETTRTIVAAERELDRREGSPA